ncbi:DUF3263 domain-containing protein [Micromonospora sp. 15K316]|uniref:DUF3263 domain-containing protein n=1 Tax=Micromonospora sp. 15K316 TaxID=2530376 RepID=UPI001049240D|nr:DUF3263 domain-containing protein [Micromonospora sp. 15K316]TDC32735.1 DUF3263 domain-containing protein [Micromonospora sp. 15K316]
MQPADAAPAAAEPPTNAPADSAGAARTPAPRAAEQVADRPHDAASRATSRPVPPPRPAPAVEAVPGEVVGVVEADGADVAAVSATEPAAADTTGRPADAARVQAGLTEREQAILAFEQQWWRHAGAKEQAIRDVFGLSATRYYQLLNGLLDNPAALAAEPVLIGRLRRLRSSRARNRRR